MSDIVLEKCVSSLKAVYVLCGGIVRAEDPVHLGLGWRSLRDTEPDKTGPMPSYERIEAAAAIHRMNPHVTLYLMGGKCNDHEPYIADVMRAELLQLRVAEHALVNMGGRDTQEQLRLVAKSEGQKRSGFLRRKQIGILTVCFHFPRIAAMIAEDRELTSLRSKRVKPLSVERVLKSFDANNEKDWRSYFADLYMRPEMSSTFRSEVLGTGQLLTGFTPYFGGPFRGFPDPLA